MLNNLKLLPLLFTGFISCNSKPSMPAPKQISQQNLAQNMSHHSSEPQINILREMLAGEIDTEHNAVKWTPTPGDIEEFKGQITDKSALYSFIDTVFKIKRENDTLYQVIFRTSPMTIEEGQFGNPNNCHMCGVNLGYFSYTLENDSMHIYMFDKSFASHGSFGRTNYSLSLVNLSDGYDYLKVDDPYEGMGVQSVATIFYQRGLRVLSMISKENNSGNREKNQKGYYEFTTNFTYDKANHRVKASQTGFNIDENTGKKTLINKTKVFNADTETWQF